jgi:hypothetical protein
MQRCTKSVPLFFSKADRCTVLQVGIASRDTKQSLSVHHLIGIRIDDTDKMKCLLLAMCEVQRGPGR